MNEDLEAIWADGRTACKRCGIPCRPGESSNPNAAQTGLCVNCGITQFIRSTETLMRSLEGAGPGVLLLSHVQKKIAVLLRGGEADASPDEINWQTVVDNWVMP